MGQSPNSDDCNKEGIGLPFLQGNAEFGKKHPIAKKLLSYSSKSSLYKQYFIVCKSSCGSDKYC